MQRLTARFAILLTMTVSLISLAACSKAEEEPAAQEGITILISHTLQEDQIDVAMREIHHLLDQVRQEEDCLGIEVMQSLDDPTRITQIERWTSREAYEGPHMQTPYLQAFIARSMDFLAGPPDITFWQEALAR